MISESSRCKSRLVFVLRNEMMEIKCDKCDNEFVPKIMSQNVLNENKKDMLITFFVCDKCKEVYVVSVSDVRYRALIDSVNKSLKILKRFIKSNPGDSEGIMKRDNDYKNNKRKAIEYQNRLKNKYAKYLFLRTVTTTDKKVD